MHKSQHSSAPGSCLLAVGTYTEILPHVQGRGLGIHLLEFDGESATFRERQILAGPVNPSYLCAWGDRLSASANAAATRRWTSVPSRTAARADPSAAPPCRAPTPATSA